MQCIVHIWGSAERDRKQYLLKLFPLYSLESRRPVEEFSGEEALCRRLKEIGLSTTHLTATISSLREGTDAMWTNIDIARETLDKFGRTGDAPRLVA